jgi:hypothetical protein
VILEIDCGRERLEKEERTDRAQEGLDNGFHRRGFTDEWKRRRG